MSSLFSTPKKPPPPPAVPPPPPTPELAMETGEQAAKRIRRRSGFRRTLITGSLSPELAGKKKLLG